MRRNKARSHTHLQEEHLQAWLREAYPAETFTVPPKPTPWLKIVEINQFMWDTRSIPKDLGWTLMVMIPNENADI